MFFFLCLSLSPSVLQWHHEEGSFFLKYDQSDWLCPLISYTFKNRIISYLFWPFYLLHSLPPLHFEALEILTLQFSVCPGIWAIQCKAPNITPNQFLTEFNVQLTCEDCYFPAKCFFGNSHSHLDFPCAITRLC